MTSTRQTSLADAPRHVTTATICPHVGGPCRPAKEFCARLDQSIAVARPMLADDFDMRGTFRSHTCERDCLLAFSSTAAATWCFGDVGADADLDALIQNVGQGAASDACRAVTITRPPGRRQ